MHDKMTRQNDRETLYWLSIILLLYCHLLFRSTVSRDQSQGAVSCANPWRSDTPKFFSHLIHGQTYEHDIFFNKILTPCTRIN